jgi:hypothetical protein
MGLKDRQGLKIIEAYYAVEDQGGEASIHHVRPIQENSLECRGRSDKKYTIPENPSKFAKAAVRLSSPLSDARFILSNHQS